MPFLGVEPVQEFASVAKQTITGDGSTAYTLTHSVASANDLAVFVNNVRQEPTTAYSASGATITFTEAIASTDSCYVMYIARTFQTVSPESNSVGDAQLKSSLDLSGKTLTFANNQISGNAVDGGTISNFSSTGIDDNADAVAITIDSSENVLFGTTQSNPTSSSVNVQGIELSATGGGVRSTVDSNPAATFNRKSDDGPVVLFRKDGTTFGDISRSNGKMVLDSKGSNIIFAVGGNAQLNCDTSQFYPENDNSINLGLGSLRFKDLYLSSGVYLGGTGSANHLDDYEEGTWTPYLKGYSQSDSNLTQTYSNQTGLYRKVGNLVYATCRVTLSNKGNMSGNYVLLKGWPFNFGGTSVTAGYGSINYFANINTSVSSIWWELGGGGVDSGWLGYISGSSGTGSSYMSVSGLNNNFYFHCSAVYYTA